jgi:NAD(P)-dependent dehydrogenase (short-subunit alcohol dehydrogenase family)
MSTEDGFEMQFGVNHLGHFLLTNLLLDLLKQSSPSRVVVVSSEAHKWGSINRDDLMSEKNYVKYKVYGQSKLANILFARELGKRLEGTGVTANSCHPGVVNTELGRHSGKFVQQCFIPFFKPFFKTPSEGAQTQIMLALDPELEGVTGKYFKDCSQTTPTRAAQDDGTAEWLWNRSEMLVGF